MRKLLIAKGYDAAAIKAIEKSVKKEVDTAVEESKVGDMLLWSAYCCCFVHSCCHVVCSL